MWDEGFLWYGARQVMSGDVPLRDFMAYSPGRYYWSAAIMWIMGNSGIIALRIAIALFQIIGMVIGLGTISCGVRKKSFVFMLLAALTLVLWMVVRHKIFDTTVSIILVGALSFLVSNPCKYRFFLAGMAVGLAAAFGHNHALYGVFGSFGAMIWLGINREHKTGLVEGLLLWCLGGVVGFLPVLMMFALIPGFFEAFLSSVLAILGRSSTNISIPVIWPWNVLFGEIPLKYALRQMFTGFFFLGLPAFGFLGIGWIFFQRLMKKKSHPAVVGSVFMALPYAHHAFSRADTAHLAQGIFPFLIGMFALFSILEDKKKWVFSVLLYGITAFVIMPAHPGVHSYRHFVEVQLGCDTLWVNSGTASNISLLKELEKKYAPNGQSFVAAPFLPGAYAVLDRKSPMWEIYALWPRDAEFQKKEIERIKAADPGFILLNDKPLDGRDELRFANTHRLIDAYFKNNFDLLKGCDIPPSFQIYVKRDTFSPKQEKR